MNLIFGHLDAATFAIRRIFKQPVHGVFNIAVFSLAITLPLTFYVFIEHISKYSGSLTASPQISIFLEKNIQQKEIYGYTIFLLR